MMEDEKRLSQDKLIEVFQHTLSMPHGRSQWYTLIVIHLLYLSYYRQNCIHHVKITAYTFSCLCYIHININHKSFSFTDAESIQGV